MEELLTWHSVISRDYECSNEKSSTFYLIHISYSVLLDSSFAEIGNGVISFFH